MSARLPVEDLGELFDVELPDDDVDTVGGLLAQLLGRVPLPGSEATVHNLHLLGEPGFDRRGRPQGADAAGPPADPGRTRRPTDGDGAEPAADKGDRVKADRDRGRQQPTAGRDRPSAERADKADRKNGKGQGRGRRSTGHKPAKPAKSARKPAERPDGQVSTAPPPTSGPARDLRRPDSAGDRTADDRNVAR